MRAMVARPSAPDGSPRRWNQEDAWGWHFFEDGSLALDRHELWEEPESESALPVLQSSAVVRLKEAGPSVTVGRDMPSSRPTRRRRVERREVRAARRARNFALLVILAIVLVVALLLTAFGGGAPRMTPLAVTGISTADAQTRPSPQVVAVHGTVRLQMPVAQNAITAIGYHAAQDGAMTLAPVGRQGNEGLVQRVFHRIFGGGGGHPTWYQLGGGPTSALDVGAAPGTARVLAGRRNRRRHLAVHRRRRALRRAHRHPAAERAVSRRVADAAERATRRSASART